VPAYIGQLTAIAVGASAGGATPSRWLALRHATAFGLGFGAVFTLLGVTATFAAGPLFDYLPFLRRVGGIVLIILGLSLAGILKIPALERTWRPLDAGARPPAAATGTVALAGAGGGSSLGDRMGSRMVGQQTGLLASLSLGAIFAVGWTPCIGVILGGILGLASTSTTVLQGGVLLVAYTLGLGIPFLLLGVLYDRAAGIIRPLVRHGRVVSLIGGLLVVRSASRCCSTAGPAALLRFPVGI
jgi:cytochrome c-type biogenesis protein